MLCFLHEPEYSAFCNRFAMEMPALTARIQKKPAGKGIFRPVFPFLRVFFDRIQIVQHKPELREPAHDVPDAHPVQPVFARERQLGADRACILKPHLMLGPVAPVVVVRRLCRFVVLDGCADLDRLLDGLHVPDRPRARLAG